MTRLTDETAAMIDYTFPNSRDKVNQSSVADRDLSFVETINFVASAKRIGVKANSKLCFDNGIISVIQRQFIRSSNVLI